MGEIVAVAVVAHQPMVMVPAEVRVELGGTGADTTLIEPGYRRAPRGLRRARGRHVRHLRHALVHHHRARDRRRRALRGSLHERRDAAKHLRPAVRLPRRAGAREGLAPGRQGASAPHGQRDHRVAAAALRHDQPRAPPAPRREGRLVRRRPDRVDGLLPRASETRSRRRCGASPARASPSSGAAA